MVFTPTDGQRGAGFVARVLGTVGGNSARPADLNDRGEVVGTSRTGLWVDHAFVWDQTGMRDLGTMGYEASHAVRINEAGVIAGTVVSEYLTGVLDDNVGSGNIGAIWFNGAGRALESTRVFGGPLSEPPTGYRGLFDQPPRLVRAINVLGEVIWTNYSKFDTYGWLWRNGSLQPLQTASWGPGGAGPSRPMAMNDAGQVVGARSIYGGDGPPFRAILWERGASRDLGALSPWACGRGDCSVAVAMDINEAGQIVGISTDHTGRYHFVLWQDDKIQDLGFADWVYPQPAAHIAINDHGEIAGSAGGKAFFWSQEGRVELPSTGGLVEVVGLNESREVVGNLLMGAQQHAFVWSPDRGMVDLGTGPHGFSAAWVVDINGRGDILGYTAPCTLESPSRCANSVNDYASGSAMQVRAILWRNLQGTVSR
jgi:probable HAF family extracellular repeat protein